MELSVLFLWNLWWLCLAVKSREKRGLAIACLIPGWLLFLWGHRILIPLIGAGVWMGTLAGYGICINNCFLEKCARQGVLLLNTELTLSKDCANSHSGKGWEVLTDAIIKKLNLREEPIVFMLWGNNAKSKALFIDKYKHVVLKSVHPSPISAIRCFFGCDHFRKANDFLISHGMTPIDWQIENI